MALARLGVFAVFQLSPIFAEKGGVSNSLFFGVLFLLVGFMTFLIYTFMDRKLDKEIGETEEDSSDCKKNYKITCKICKIIVSLY